MGIGSYCDDPASLCKLEDLARITEVLKLALEFERWLRSSLGIYG